MKRFRILSFDFDSRARDFDPTQEQWDDNVKKLHLENQKKTIENLKFQYGEWFLDQKIENFVALGAKPFSVAAFHNKFLEQIRNSYIVGATTQR